MNLVIQLVLLGALFTAVFVFTREAFATVSAKWNAQIDGYASWMSIEFQSMFEEMSIERARQFITISIVGAFVFGFLLAGGSLAQRVFFGLFFALFGYALPRLVIARIRGRRIHTIDNQLVDALQMMANALRSGLSLQQALELVVREMKPPISDEFGRLVKEIHLGKLMDEALRRFAARLPLEDVQLAVDSVLTLRETGGNLSDTFQVIATTIVERKKVQGKIQAMTAQGMTQGIVVCSMPLVLMFIFTLIDPNYMTPFFTHPIGWVMMFLIFLLDAMGLWLMFKLVKVDV